MLHMWHIPHRMQLSCRLMSFKKLLYAKSRGLSLHESGTPVALGHYNLYSTSSVLDEKDFYKVLGVTKKASSEEIKKAYLLAAKRHHPDTADELTTSDKDKFHEVQEAYEVLGDKARRIEYDIKSGRRHSIIRQRYSNRAVPWNRSASHIEETRSETVYEPRDGRLDEPVGRTGLDTKSFLYIGCCLMVVVWFTLVIYFGML